MKVIFLDVDRNARDPKPIPISSTAERDALVTGLSDMGFKEPDYVADTIIERLRKAGYCISVAIRRS